MPKATLTFLLPEEQAEFDTAARAQDYKSCIWDIDQYCRGVIKHGEPLSEDARHHIEYVRSIIREFPGVLE